MKDTEWVRRAVDGELDAEARARLEARCAERPALAETLRQQQHLVSRLGALREGAGAERAETTERIMAEVRSRARRAASPGWLRPASALAAGVALLATGLAFGYLLGSRSGAPSPDHAGPAAPQASPTRTVPGVPPPSSRRRAPARCSPDVVLVRFSIRAARAHSVALVGDFNGWRRDQTLLEDADGDGVWRVTLPLKRGSYQYAFVIDGKRWVPDPSASLRPDGFGGTNSVISL